MIPSSLNNLTCVRCSCIDPNKKLRLQITIRQHRGTDEILRGSIPQRTTTTKVATAGELEDAKTACGASNSTDDAR